MKEEFYQVEVGDKSFSYPAGTPYGEIVRDFKSPDGYPIVLVRANGRLRELHKTLKRDCRLELITTATPTGHKTYKRSMSLLLLTAVYHVAGRENLEKIILHYSVGNGFYYTIRGNVRLDGEFLARVKSYMEELVAREEPIFKYNLSTVEARELFARNGMWDKEKLFRYRRVSKVNIYRLEDYEDYFYGFMVWHTGYLKYFDLRLYDEGFILEMPDLKDPTQVPPFRPSPKIFKAQQEAERWGEQLGLDTVGALNECISQGKIHHSLLVAEALQESKIARIAEMILARPDVKFVLVAGPSSSGKTTFSRRMAIQLTAHGMRPHAISLDNYYYNRVDTPRDETGRYDFECLEALDLPLLNQQMGELLQGKEIEMPRFNFHTGEREYRGDRLRLEAEDILILEGIHGLNEKLSASVPADKKFKIYISALTQLNVDEHNRIPTTDGRLIRRIVRDNRTRSTLAQETIAMWDSVRRGEEKHIFPYQEDADVMFNSALVYELSILKLYAEPLLFQIPEDAPEYLEAKRLLKFLDYFLGMPSEDIPKNSILREFVGGSCFDV